ncbi:MAG: glycosyltransferase family 39 protein [Lachnospiraceae bacterium]|nr:glycosyltransferase family 39 protein [Lachnospiraceae bacterium]
MDLSRREYIFFIALLIIGSAFLSVFAWKRSGNMEKALSLFLFINAFFLHAFYIAYTPTYVRQHDVIGFGNNKGIGQAALIEYLMNAGRLPDFDPRTRWGFFQPLLHHIIAAVFLKINLLRGLNYGAAAESIQILTLIYSMVFILYGLRIFKLMGLKGKGFIVSGALLSFHPLLTLLSGSVNNDMLSHMFFVMAVFYVLKWFKEDRLSSLILTALTIGLSMMAKLSGVLAAPAVAFLMLYRLYKDKNDRESLIKRIRDYALFALTVFPLGLFFPIRNMILFHVPLSYMPEVGEDVSGHSLLSRIFDIRTSTPYACMIKNGHPYDEYNIFLTFIKTSLTGEYDYSAENPYITGFAWALFLAGVLLFIITAVLFILFILGKCSIKDVPIRLFWSILILTGVIFMLRLSVTVPNFSSGDMRYIAWIVVPSAMLPGLFIEDGETWSSRAAGIVKNCICGISAVFSVASLGVYYLLGLP